jgi:hypothetical protein
VAYIGDHLFHDQFNFIDPRAGKASLARLRRGEFGAVGYRVNGQRFGALRLS